MFVKPSHYLLLSPPVASFHSHSLTHSCGYAEKLDNIENTIEGIHAKIDKSERLLRGIESLPAYIGQSLRKQKERRVKLIKEDRSVLPPSSSLFPHSAFTCNLHGVKDVLQGRKTVTSNKMCPPLAFYIPPLPLTHGQYFYHSPLLHYSRPHPTLSSRYAW